MNDRAVYERLLGDVTAERVLALACGQGQDARLLASLGAQVVCVDLSERMLAHAREPEEQIPRGIRYVQGGVACHMALMDIARLEPTIASTARVLRAGGWFVLSYERKLPNDALPGHAYHRPIGAYVNALVRAGFAIGELVEVHHIAGGAGGDVPGLLYLRCVKHPPE